MSDLISRQAVIDAVADGLKSVFVENRDVAETLLKNLPSAQPEQPEIQDILDYLDTVLHPIVSPDHWNVYSELHDMISSLSPAQPERELGEWIDDGDPLTFTCSKCGYSVARHNNTKFCQNCGADMRGEQDDKLSMAIEALSAEAVQGWIPFKKRPLTDEEREEYPDWAYIFDCPLPDDEEEILLSNGKYVWTDTFINDGECYLDGGDDIDDGMAWMPMPKPYREDGEA